ncbi:hypothetical protein CPA50_11285 [Marinobacter sp. ANT_B65]|nr:hypothetical protein CPA50_11285 [Marinobacter sp. ANT_B65]
MKRSFHGDYLTIRVLNIRELAEKLITKTGAAFYANFILGSMFIDTRLCRCRVFVVRGSGKARPISRITVVKGLFYNSFKRSIITVITQAIFCGKGKFFNLNQQDEAITKLSGSMPEPCG